MSIHSYFLFKKKHWKISFTYWTSCHCKSLTLNKYWKNGCHMRTFHRSIMDKINRLNGHIAMMKREYAMGKLNMIFSFDCDQSSINIERLLCFLFLCISWDIHSTIRSINHIIEISYKHGCCCVPDQRLAFNIWTCVSMDQ
jgi:hypothetical protein